MAMLFIDGGEFVNVDIELGKCGVKIWGFFTKPKNKNSGIIVETVGIYIVKQFWSCKTSNRTLYMWLSQQRLIGLNLFLSKEGLQTEE